LAADKLIFFVTTALITIGIVFSMSLTVYAAPQYGYDELHFFIRQAIVGMISIFIIWAISRLNPDKHFKLLGFSIFILFLIMMSVMPFLSESYVTAVGGAKRWIKLPMISLAPVEFFKVGFVFFIAWSFSRKLIHRGRLSLKREILVLLPYLGVFALAVVLIAIFQKDLGQVVVLAATLMVLFIMAGRSMKLFFLFFMLGIAGFIGLILVAPHRLQRIRSWWSTVQDNFLSFFPSDIVEKLRIPETSEPYQISNSLNAVYNGGWFGQGLGNGQFKLGYLSEVHTDFILAGLSEELGYVFLVLVSCLVVFIIFRLLRIASRLGQPAYYIYSVGVALLILFAFVVNSYGISGITPIKGIAVPFLSYGGSQIIAGSIGVGMVLMISKKA